MDANTHGWKGRVLGAVSGPRKKFGFAGQTRDHRGSVRVGQAGQRAWVKTVSRLGAELVAVCSGVLIAVSAVFFCQEEAKRTTCLGGDIQAHSRRARFLRG
jgi:hypothetical protein